MTPAERAAHRIAADLILANIADPDLYTDVPELFIDDVRAHLHTWWAEHDDATATDPDIDQE